jgi:hypothetical protein
MKTDDQRQMKYTHNWEIYIYILLSLVPMKFIPIGISYVK